MCDHASIQFNQEKIMAYELKSDKPVPAPRMGGVPKYPWREMNIGEYFFVPRTDFKFENYRPKPPKDLGFKIVTRKLCENGITGVAIWRIA